MGYFWSGILVILILAVLVVYKLCKVRKEPMLYSPWEWVSDKKYFIIAPLTIVILIYIWVLKVPLWKTIDCQYEGSNRGVETKYNWFKKTCYYKTKSGTWLPLVLGRDTPENKEGSDNKTEAEHLETN